MILKKTTLVLAALLLIFFMRGCALNNYHSITSDEPPSFSMGATYWLQHDFSYSPSHPPLKSYLTHWFTQHLNPDNTVHREQGVDEFLSGKLYLFKENIAIFRDLIWWGRLPFLLFGILGMIYVYLWTKELTNRKTALVASTLYAFFPAIVALSAIADNDIIVSTMFIITLYYFQRYLKTGKTLHAVLTGIGMGIALLSKHTAILLVPIMIAAAVILLFLKQPLPRLGFLPKIEKKTAWGSIISLAAFFAFIGIISGTVLNAGYFFDGTFTPLGDFDFQYGVFPWHKNPALSWIPVPLPYWYLKGFEQNQILAVDEHYFHGKRITTEDWYFYLFSFLTKTPLALLILTAIGLFMIPKMKEGRISDLVIISIAVMAIMLMFSTKQYKRGLRLILAMFPFLFIFAGITWNQVMQSGKPLLKKAGILLLAWCLISSIWVHPYYMSYFNEFIGGPKNGYKWFLDSNVDWGQDLNAVKQWMDKKGIPEIGLSYYGSDVPDLRGIKWHMIPCEPTPGLHVLSVNNLFGNIFTGQPTDCYSWLRKVEPSDRIAYSILVFDIPEKA